MGTKILLFNIYNGKVSTHVFTYCTQESKLGYILKRSIKLTIILIETSFIIKPFFFKKKNNKTLNKSINNHSKKPFLLDIKKHTTKTFEVIIIIVSNTVIISIKLFFISIFTPFVIIPLFFYRRISFLPFL